MINNKSSIIISSTKNRGNNEINLRKAFHKYSFIRNYVLWKLKEYYAPQIFSE